MLRLESIVKDYPIDRNTVTHALRGINLEFGDSGFVAILGPSGCGKTTLLNILSGLDRYTSGDLIIDGVSTKKYNDRMWDDYRNKKVGMVFQSYNLIPHLSIWENAALPLTLAGVSHKEKKRKALKVLSDVGLKDQAKKKPNQLSGGQQQRIAIARAIINDPSIILADEPTGALDTKTSVQVMEILAELSHKRLVVMVTHNRELAYRYADRIISMKDGEVVSDVMNDKEKEAIPHIGFFPMRKKKASAETRRMAALASFRRAKEKTGGEEPLYVSELPEKKIFDEEVIEVKSKHNRKSRMSFLTAFVMSAKNLLTKKGRTALTAVASSFGIIGVGLVLAVSNGFTQYISRLESESLAQFPITISSQTISLVSENIPELPTDRYPDDSTVHVTPSTSSLFHINDLTPEYYDDFLSRLDPDLYSSIKKNYSMTSNVVTKSGPDDYVSINTSSSGSILSSLISSSSWQELPGSEDFILSQYDLIAGEYPSSDDPSGLLITVDAYNSISADTLSSLGFDSSMFPAGQVTDLSFESLQEKDYRLFSNDDFYSTENGAVNDDVRGLALLDPSQYHEFISDLSRLSAGGQDMSEEDLKNEAIKLLSYFVDIPADIDSAKLLLALIALQSFASGNGTWKSTLDTVFSCLEEAGIKINPVTSLESYVKPDSKGLKNLYEYGNLEGIEGEDKGTDLHIVGILRPKKTTSLGILGNGIYYTSALADIISESARTSKIAQACGDRMMIDLGSLTDDEARNLISQIGTENPDLSSITGLMTCYSIYDADQTISQSDYMTERGEVGTDADVSSITIYPKDFESKDKILAYLDSYNQGKDEEDQIIYTDVAGTVTGMVGTMVEVISTVLIVFASISLAVSSVMIGIIVYVSVIERTKEIGTLRSVGARKKDVSRLFIMESVAIGILSGVIGVLATYILSIPINAVINAIYSDFSIGNIALLNPLHGLLLIAISAVLTFIAGMIPARIAGRKDPVKCLRTE